MSKQGVRQVLRVVAIAAKVSGCLKDCLSWRLGVPAALQERGNPGQVLGDPAVRCVDGCGLQARVTVRHRARRMQVRSRERVRHGDDFGVRGEKTPGVLVDVVADLPGG
ncbi:hypothetical protein [Streptomyces sp. NBC_01198]|uniref:hypothetical protein n=1 Tax=Streptomyces sp. NBC_01198 TaxID=2903769 RepID=UPI002E1637C5|nr:hypothetical protein OG702_00035 [Streptomyces sp. NBC_01198]WSR66434.1 hypothetical protein OG702_35325 [Streptomyces sp. NBC_01198]